jgi:hypothetical protein
MVMGNCTNFYFKSADGLKGVENPKTAECGCKGGGIEFLS